MAPRRSRRLASQEPEIEVTTERGPVAPTPKRSTRRAAMQEHGKRQVGTRRSTRTSSSLSQDVSSEETSRPPTSASEAAALPSREIIPEEREGEEEEESPKYTKHEKQQRRDLDQIEEDTHAETQQSALQMLQEQPYIEHSEPEDAEEERENVQLIRAQAAREDVPQNLQQAPREEEPSQALTIMEETATRDTPTPATPATPVPAWRRYLTSAVGILSPWGRRSPQTVDASIAVLERKRSAPEDEGSIPNKRARTAETLNFTARASRPKPLIPATEPRKTPLPRNQALTPAKALDLASHHSHLAREPGSLSLSQRQSGTPARHIQRTSQPKQQQRSAEQQNVLEARERSAIPSGNLAPTSRKRSAPVEPEPSTPTPSQTRSLIPSTQTAKKNAASLAPITEQDEAFRPSMVSKNNPAFMYTPSKPPATAPVRRRTMAEVRASKLAGTPSMKSRSGPFAWEIAAAERERARDAIAPGSLRAPHKPKEANADERYAKLERLRQLEKQLQELKKDADVMEMESHRRKRVKVDSLAFIPHNRPGDAKSTFRVPDIDSDDEMEVEDAVPERVNVFEQARKAEPAQSAPPAAPPTTKEPTHPQAPILTQKETQGPERAQEKAAERALETPKFNFPSAGKRMVDYRPSLDYIEGARSKFATGFQAWKLVQGY